ncbi:hypothetical protein MTAT_03760 [Moorella thermoacetica]|uniref:Uncharacterized protein n=1 Tax=Neomoorella thermoacetica TaxID=1525 RepID=A0ABY3NA39_NEOTH|nr:hypothetical protein MTAT_03760 [Moorella thermoacetica]
MDQNLTKSKGGDGSTGIKEYGKSYLYKLYGYNYYLKVGKTIKTKLRGENRCLIWPMSITRMP